MAGSELTCRDASRPVRIRLNSTTLHKHPHPRSILLLRIQQGAFQVSSTRQIMPFDRAIAPAVHLRMSSRHISAILPAKANPRKHVLPVVSLGKSLSRRLNINLTLLQMQCDGMQVIQMMAVVEMINDGPIAYWWVSIETLRYTSTTIHTATVAGLRLLTSDGIHLAHVAFGKRV